MKWNVTPCEKVGPLFLGMSEKQVEAEIGPIINSNHDEEEKTEYRFLNSPVVVYKDGSLVEIIFSKHSDYIYFDGFPVFNDPLVTLEKIERRGASFFESVGIVFCTKLCISCSGFHDGDIDQLSFGLFKSGRFDDFLEDAQPVSFMNSR